MDKKGYTFVEILVAIGIMVVVSASVSYTLLSARKMKKQIDNKMEVVTYEHALQVLMSRKEDCDCQVRNLTFDSTNLSTAKIQLSSIKMSCAEGAADFLSVSSDKLPNTVKSIYISSITGTGVENEYISSIYLIAHTQELVLNSTAIKFRFYTDPTSGATQKKIIACGFRPLTNPTNLSALPMDKSCKLNWTPSSGASPIEYHIKKSTTLGQTASSGVDMGYTQNSSIIASNLQNGVNYYFSIQAVNSSELSDWSSEVSCRPFQPPGAPTLAAHGVDGKCVIAINKPAQGSGEMKYDIFQGSSSGVTASSPMACQELLATGQQTLCVASGLTNGVTYYFAGTTKNNEAVSALSSEVSCKPTSTSPTIFRTESIKSGSQTRFIGNYHYCVLYSHSGDSEGKNTYCRITGGKDNSWYLSLSDEGKKAPVNCRSLCSKATSYEDENKHDGGLCFNSSKNMSGVIYSGKCCVGTKWEVHPNPGSNFNCYDL